VTVVWSEERQLYSKSPNSFLYLSKSISPKAETSFGSTGLHKLENPSRSETVFVNWQERVSNLWVTSSIIFGRRSQSQKESEIPNLSVQHEVLKPLHTPQASTTSPECGTPSHPLHSFNPPQTPQSSTVVLDKSCPSHPNSAFSTEKVIPLIVVEMFFHWWVGSGVQGSYRDSGLW